MLAITLLGDFSIRIDHAPVTEVSTSRLQSLLAYLLLHKDAPQSRAHLAFLFWPDTSEAQARTNLRNLLHHLRQALPNAGAYIDAGGLSLRWRTGLPLTLDVDAFQSALDAAHQLAHTGGAARRAALEHAVTLYKGDLLPSCYDDWLIPLREELLQTFLTALEQLVALQEEQRDYPAAIFSAGRLLRADPLHEATYRRLIRLHALNGDRAGALRVYHTCSTVLQRELGVEPGAATREAYEHVLGAQTPPPASLPATSVYLPLVGREREWAQMLQAWRGVVAGDGPHVVSLCGEAGIGKTRLAEDLLQWAARQGITTAGARCYAAEGQLAYAPVTAWLRSHPLPSLPDIWLVELARLLPEVLEQQPRLQRPAAFSEAWQRQQLFEALARAVLGVGQPLLLVLDDVQWCDSDTLEWLHFLLRFDGSARLAVVLTYRPEEVATVHPLLSLLESLRLDGQVTELDIPPLDEAATRTLASHVAGADISAETAQLLYRETEGNPLFVVESVHAGLPSRDTATGDGRLPPKVHSVLAARLAQLSPPARELAGLAATIGREFSVALLAQAGGRDDDTLVRELDELWRRRIVRERGAAAYDFSHDKLREVAYGSLSTARRRLLHRLVAQALQALHAADPDTVSRQAAAHYELAGLPGDAVPCYLSAAAAARRVFSNQDAIGLLRRGLALLPQTGAAGRSILSASLWEALADVLELTAQHEPALQAYTNGQACVPGDDRVWLARLQRKEGIALREQRRYADALAACRRGEATLGEAPATAGDDWWTEWIQLQVDRVWAHYWLAQWPDMDALVGKIEPVVRARGGADSRARFLMVSCLVHLRKDRYVVSDQMLADTVEALALSEQAGSLKDRIDQRFEVGFLHLWRRELAQAEADLQAALKLAETSGAAWMRTLSLTYLTVLRRFQGDLAGVEALAARARSAALDSHMPDYVAAATANQAWLAWRHRVLDAAAGHGREALAQWRQSPLVYPFQWLALWPLIAVSLARQAHADAWALSEALLEPAQQRLPDALNDALQSAARAHAAGQSGEAHRHLSLAAAIAENLGYL